jgi:GNAT superfamily N-acetyltransferase
MTWTAARAAPEHTSEDSVTLADGTRVLIRPLRPDEDGPALAAAYLALSPEAKVARFGSPPARLQGRTLERLLDVDADEHVAFVAMLGDRLVGVARALRYPDDRDTLDVAITVADDLRGRGLGGVLARLLVVARPAPARRIRTSVRRGNQAALHLLALFGEVEVRSDEEVLVALADSISAGPALASTA